MQYEKIFIKIYFFKKIIILKKVFMELKLLKKIYNRFVLILDLNKDKNVLKCYRRLNIFKYFHYPIVINSFF